MVEYVKFNCHVMARNTLSDKINPDELYKNYLNNRKNGYDYIFDNIECIVSSCTWASGRSAIITKILRKADINNEDICTK